MGASGPTERLNGPLSVLVGMTTLNAVGIEPVLQDENGGDLVDDVFSVARATADGVEMAVSLGGTEAFIPQVNGELKFGAQCVGEFLRREGARAAVAGEMNRPANDNFRAGVAPQQTPQRTQVVARIGVDDGEERLGGQAELVRNGDTNPARSMVEPENTRGRRWGWRRRRG